MILETPRLIIKAPALSDLEDLIALRSDIEVMRYTGVGRVQTREEVEEFLAAALVYQAKYGFGFCSVFEKETGDFVGQAGLFHLGFDESKAEIEIAYRLHKKCWGKGYATELARALIAWGFENLDLDKIIAVFHPDNIGSQRVLEKAGMYYVEHMDYKGVQVPCYHIYKNDKVELIKYDARWPSMAATEIEKMHHLLPKQYLIDIQHVGSTAIPNMLAKPIIDIQIATSSLSDIKPIAIAALQSHGYTYWKENPDPTRLFFVKGMPPFGLVRTHHVHIVEPESAHWQDKLLFRDYLITHPEVAARYQELKMDLAQRYKYDREKYTLEKTQFINEALQQARALISH